MISRNHIYYVLNPPFHVNMEALLSGAQRGMCPDGRLNWS